MESLESVKSVSPSDNIKAAKFTELHNWCTFQVHDDVEDTGQIRLSTRWAITEKLDTTIDGQQSVKARLAARGFEEHSVVRPDSSTSNKESLCIFLAITATMIWKAPAIDTKAPFLQGEEINRTIFLQPTSEAETDNKL